MIVPLTILAFIACIGVSFIPGEVGTYLSLGIIAAAFIGMMVINNMSKKKIHDQNVKSVDLIKKHVGEKRFEKLLDLKKDYVDEYFNALYPDEEDEEKLEETPWRAHYRRYFTIYCLRQGKGLFHDRP